MKKEAIYGIIENKSSVLRGLSDKIWEYAELSMAEYKSASAYCELLRQEGFRVETNLCGIPTAFSGSFGSGKPVIGILGEFDALSGLSQAAGVAEKQPLEAGGCGHGCGHNLLGAASLGAAIAIKEEIKASRLSGTVVFYGCPGEEGCAGKTFMARDGMFRDLDAALCWHPGDTNEVTTGSNAASLQVAYTFTGVAAHAAGDPFNGRSALDAAELMNVGVQFLREHMPPKASVHYSFLDAGGVSPNVVQPTATVDYMIRGENVTKAKALWQRVNDIARGAALMTGTEVCWKQIDGTASTLSNSVLEEALYRNLCQAPMPEYTAEEFAFAEALRETYPHDTLPGGSAPEDSQVAAEVRRLTDGNRKAIADFIVPYKHSDRFSPGSTDVGDVSWLTPTAQITTATWTCGVPGHSWQVVSTGKTSIAYKGMEFAAKVLAGTAADLMTDSALLQRARDEFSFTAAAGYDCPIGKEVRPTIG